MLKRTQIKYYLALTGLIISLSALGGQTIHMAGDSTMSIKETKDYPETDWGTPFATFFNSSTTVINHAKNGRSTRTFIEEGRWQRLISGVKSGHYVVIQFGHNDQSKHKPDRYTSPVEYRTNLNRFISDITEKKASTILLTPMIRRRFDEHGKILPSHPYAEIVREIALQNPPITFIDLEKITKQYFEELGRKASALRFLHIRADTHPNYPNGITDNTHLNELGAREIAQLVLRELKQLDHPLAGQIRSVDPKHLKERYKPEL